MTRSVITPRIAYSGSGTSGPFTVPFTYTSNDHVLVYLIDSSETKTLFTEGTNYTLTSNTVTTTDTVDVGEYLVIYRETPVEQDVDFPANGSYSSTNTESAFDKLTDLVSEVKARVDFFGLPLSGKAPTDASIRGRNLKINSTGTALEAAEAVDVSVFVPGQHCLVVATSNITLSGTQTIDGVGVVATNIVLVAGQTDKSENGVYVVAAGAWTRHEDHDTTAGLQAMTAFYITSGTSYADTIWVCGTLDPVVDTDDIFIGQLAADVGAANVNINSGGTINFNSGDVVGQHSSNALAWTGGQWSITYNGGATAQPLRLVNSTDNASVAVLSLEGDRATMADNDEAYISLKVSNDAGTQTEIGRITWVATDVNNATSEDGRIDFAVLTGASLADELQLTGTALSPSTNGGIALGTTSLGYDGLHLKTGAAVNWANGEITLTETDANTLTLAGGTFVTSNATSATAQSLTATNAFDNATVKAATFGGDRATPSDADTSYIAFELSDDAGAQTEFARISWHADDVSDTTEDGHLRFWTMTGGTLNAELYLDGAALKPVANAGLALGTTSLGYNGLHLSTGTAINWANGEITITETDANTLSFAGATTGYSFDDDILLPSGGVINWASGEVTITETDANTLTVAGAASVSLGTSTALTTGTIELGAATDTTLSRASAGRLAVEGVTLGITTETAVASTSGTAINFTSIPSWAQEINIMFSGVSTNGVSTWLVQIGDSGGIENTGYLGASGAIQGSPAATRSTSGFIIGVASASAIGHGSMRLNLVSAATNTWVSSHGLGFSDSDVAISGGGSKSLSATLDRVRITTTNGTDAFDAGTINISYQ